MQPIDLSIFPPEREQALCSIERYNKFGIMFYRSNLWQHAQRVLWITEALIPIAGKYLEFDPEKARALALVHDDPEMVTGDTAAHVKTAMTPEETAAHDQNEIKAIESLASSYPDTVHGYSYKELLLHSLRKDCPEAWLVSYADKLDAYGESLHDLLAGNFVLLWPVMFYVLTLDQFPKKLPGLASLLASSDSVLTDPKSRRTPDPITLDSYLGFGTPHTIESVRKNTDFPLYDAWKQIVLEGGSAEGLDWLTMQKEGL